LLAAEGLDPNPAFRIHGRDKLLVGRHQNPAHPLWCDRFRHSPRQVLNPTPRAMTRLAPLEHDPFAVREESSRQMSDRIVRHFFSFSRSHRQQGKLRGRV